MRMYNLIFIGIAFMPFIAFGAVVYMIETSTLPTMESLKNIYNILFGIAVFILVASMAVIYFGAKKGDRALQLGLVGSLILFVISTVAEQIPV